MSKIDKFRQLIYNQHNVVCNQQYGKLLPYSFHLDAVESQGEKFIHLIPDQWVQNQRNFRSREVRLRDVVRYALISHDTIEDARFTYNDLLETVNTEEFGNYTAAVMVADIVYCVTDEKGKNRKERKNAKYYEELKANDLAVFVKLADLAANTLYSKLTGSSMYDKYKKEWPKFRESLYLFKYDEFFNYVENL